jgi:hypothetical protein
MNYLIFPKAKNKKSGDVYAVTGISKDKDGKVWIATYPIYILDRIQSHALPFQLEILFCLLFIHPIQFLK